MKNFPRPRVRLRLLVAVLGFLLSATSATSSPRPPAIGAGSHPLTFTHAAAWFVQRADDRAKVLTLLVYFEGEPGWHQHATDFEWQVNKSPASIHMKVGDRPIDIEYDASKASAKVVGKTFQLTESNVFLVHAFDTRSPRIEPLGIHDLNFTADQNPAVVLPTRDAGVRLALLGRPSLERSAVPAKRTSSEVRAWNDEGLRLMSSSDPDDARKAVELFRRAAEAGDAVGQYRLGYCYESGRGLEANPAMANGWYRKAAEQGHVDAQYKLAHSYRVGRGVAVDLAESYRWYEKAAAQGDADARYNLGCMASLGMGVPVDSSKAFAWFAKAAEVGSVGSQFLVARLQWEGRVVARDPASAYGWWLVFESQNPQVAPEVAEQVARLRQSIASSLGTEARARGQALARERMRLISSAYIEHLAR